MFVFVVVAALGLGDAPLPPNTPAEPPEWSIPSAQPPRTGAELTAASESAAVEQPDEQSPRPVRRANEPPRQDRPVAAFWFIDVRLP